VVQRVLIWLLLLLLLLLLLPGQATSQGNSQG
jgi:hypothetical protein